MYTDLQSILTSRIIDKKKKNKESVIITNW